MLKSILQIIYMCSAQKTARKNTKYSRNETILKIGNHAKVMQNPHFGSKIKTQKSMSKSILEIIYTSCAQKTARKNTKYSRNKPILKIGHHAKATAHVKSSLGEKLKFQKTCQNPFYKSFRNVLSKICSKKNQIFEK